MARSRSSSEISDILERITRSEERMVALAARHEEWHREATTAVQEARTAVVDVGARLDALELTLARYQGSWGTFTLVFSAIVMSLTFFKDFVLKRLGFHS